ncbi:MAG: thioredoxin domain-containing protein [Polyangiaceae bacterium]|nr:thioredoxin domain-containing protein [Polyangiaceae bacterium]
MNHNRSVRILRAVGLMALLLAAGCNKKPAGASGSGVSADLGATANACSKLADKLCTEVGKETPGCQAAKTSLELLSDKACSVGLSDFSATQAKLKKQGKKCDELVDKLCAAIGPDTDTCKMVKEKTKSFPPAQCSMMLGQIDEIVRELKQQELARKPLDAAAQAKIAAGDAPSFGPADARVTLVEFSDFQCPYCSRAAAVTAQLKEKYGTKVRFIFRQFPLSFHQNAEAAAEASLAADAQGKFWEMHDKMFANQGSLDRGSLEGYAKDIGLNLAKFKKALDSKETEARVKADQELGTQVAVQGTPSLFVNGKRVENPADFGAVSAAIDTALGS